MNASRIAAVTMFAAIAAACSSSSTPAGGSGSEDAGESSSSGSSSGGSSSGSSSSGGSSSGGSASSSGGSGSGSGSSSGGSGSGGTANPDAGGGSTDAGVIPANAAKIVLNIPSAFKGTTAALYLIYNKTVPITFIPAGTLYQEMNPVVTAGEALTVYGDATGVKGSYYVIAVLYMQGGGMATFQPSPGIDYEAQTSSAMSFDGTSIDLGTLTLALATDGGA